MNPDYYLITNEDEQNGNMGTDGSSMIGSRGATEVTREGTQFSRIQQLNTKLIVLTEILQNEAKVIYTTSIHETNSFLPRCYIIWSLSELSMLTGLQQSV